MPDRRGALQQIGLAALVPGLGVLPGLSGCTPKRASHGFYVWQRAWRPALTAAFEAAQPQVGNWRVLALQVDGTKAHASLVDWAVLRASQRPVHMVVRVEGSQTGVLDDALMDQIKRLAQRWRAQGLPLAGIELDHDVAESQLQAYARWLSRLRLALPGVSLSITALPAWLRSPALPRLFALPDEVVLQVHAVNSPSAALFESRLAQGWITTLVQRHAGPFRVALPCYGSRVVFNEWGEALAVESETDVPVRSSKERELLASPLEAARLLSWLDADAPAQLQGLMWFRLPTLDDQRSWRLSTWQSLVSGTRSWAPVQASLVATADPHLWEVHLRNPSMLDQDLPRHIALPVGIQAFDGEQGYGADVVAATPRLVRAVAGWLRPQEQTRVGWVRCAQPPAQKVLPVHVS